MDAVVPQLPVQRLGQGRHEGLRRRVGRATRCGREARYRRHVEDAAASGVDHRGRGGQSETVYCGHVDLDHCGGPFGVQFVEWSLEPEPGVVDEQIDRCRCVRETSLHGRQRRPVGEVGDQHLTLDVDGVGQFPQPLLVARNEHQGSSGFGELNSDRPTDPRRRSRHQSPRPCGHGPSLVPDADTVRGQPPIWAAAAETNLGEVAAGASLARRVATTLTSVNEELTQRSERRSWGYLTSSVRMPSESQVGSRGNREIARPD